MKEKILKGIALFFVLMFCCTLIARGADSVTVAKVSIDKIKQGNLVEEFEGTGKIQARDKVSQFLPEGQKVKEILVETGSQVEKGTQIVQLDLEYLQQEMTKQQREIDKMKLQIEQQELSSQKKARMPADTQAELALDRAADVLRDAQKVYQEATDELEAWQSTDTEDMDEEAFQAYEQKMAILREQWNAAEQNLKSADSAYDQAVENYEIARQEEQMAQENEAASQEAARLSVESLQIELEGLEEKLSRLTKIWEEQGIVAAVFEGAIESVGIKNGAVTTGSEEIVFASGGMEACGMVPEEKTDEISQGDEVTVQISGRSKKMTLQVEEMRQDSEGNTLWYAPIEDENIRIGTPLAFEFQKKSEETYQQVIPLSALREERGTTYVLIAETRSGILGENETAVKMGVTVLKKDKDHAAIESSLNQESRIIIQSNKYVKEGDRIRISE